MDEKIYQEAAKGGFKDPDLAERVRVFEENHGFDKPLSKQFIKYISNVVRSDLGRSILNRPKSVNWLLAESLIWTVELGFLTLILAFLVGTFTGAVLVMRERGYVEMARMYGTSPLGIIFKEMIPNLTPYILASFVASVSGAILATVGLEALGLGPADDSTLGRMIYLNIFYGTVLHGLWWWLVAPIAVLVVLFVGLFMISAGLDEVANPRLRRRV